MQVPFNLKVILIVVFAVLLFLAVGKTKNRLDRAVTQKKTAKKMEKGCNGVPLNETVFVAIPCSEDRMSEVIELVSSLFNMAGCSRRIHVGICMHKRDARRRVEGGGFHSKELAELLQREIGVECFKFNVRLFTEPTEEARGVSNAMYLIQKYLYRGEKYYCCITDTHGGLSLRDGWEKTAISDLRRATSSFQAEGVQPILTMPTGRRGIVRDEAEGESEGVPFGRFAYWSEFGTPILKVSLSRKRAIRPLRSPFFHADFVFAEAKSLIQANPWDPWLQGFKTDLLSWVLGIRLWTSGWEFFLPTVSPLVGVGDIRYYEGRSESESLLDMEKVEGDGAVSLQRLWTILGFPKSGSSGDEDGVHMGVWGLGGARSLEHYRWLCGVDWLERVVYPHSKVGMCLGREVDGGAEGNQMFDAEDVISRYGSWTEFWERTDYDPSKWETTPGALKKVVVNL